MRFPLLTFLILPIAELYLLFTLADEIGGLNTLLIVIVTAIIGVVALRRQGLSALRRANQRIQEGQVPAQELLEGMLLSFAGIMLILPGLITDTIGLVLIIPAIRQRFARRLMNNGSTLFAGGIYRGGAAGGFNSYGGFSKQGGQGDIIDGEVVDRDRPRHNQPGLSRDDDNNR